ncbi:MAG: hypothetical protein JSU65_10265 [Candidatus Zixiibacteriota bacterium]|nr:MAG: hypothetical protein JSU65_10265 [candidate division Zixibacteria bacterium]
MKSILAGLEAGAVRLTEDMINPNDDATKRYGAIPLMFEKQPRREIAVGRITYDSWRQGPAPALRNVMDGHLRRLTLKAGSVKLEIVAQKVRNDWEFVARVYSRKGVRHDMVLRVGRRKILAGSGGYFLWSSKLVPRNLQLLSYEHDIVFEQLSWQ